MIIDSLTVTPTFPFKSILPINIHPAKFPVEFEHIHDEMSCICHASRYCHVRQVSRNFPSCVISKATGHFGNNIPRTRIYVMRSPRMSQDCIELGFQFACRL